MSTQADPINFVREHHYTILCGASIFKEMKKDHAEKISKHNDAVRRAKLALEKCIAERDKCIDDYMKERQGAKERVRDAYKAWVDFIAAYTKERTQDFIDNTVSMEEVRRQIRQCFPPTPIHPDDMSKMFDNGDFSIFEIKEIYESLEPITHALRRLSYGEEHADA